MRFVSLIALSGIAVAAPISAQVAVVDEPLQQAGTVLTSGPAPTHPSQYSVEVVASGLEQPWSLAFLPDGRMLVTELPGRLRIIDQGGQASEPLEGLPAIRAVASGAPTFPPYGLHDVALDPAFSRNRRVYLSYLAPPAGQPAGAIAAEPYREWVLSSPEERERNPIGIPQVASARLSAERHASRMSGSS
jgi:glucose/arabinose dehydrogenase